MVTEIDASEPVAARHRLDFRRVLPLGEGRTIVAMELEPQVVDDADDWQRVCALWIGLPPHPNLLDALMTYGEHGLLLRYAALNWKEPLAIGTSKFAETILAGWMMQLVESFSLVTRVVPKKDLNLFAHPLVKIDLEDGLRLGFLPHRTYDLPPELSRRKPQADERSFVFLIGTVIDSLVEVLPSAIWSVVRRCLEPKPAQRFQTLADLALACRYMGRPFVRTGATLSAWKHAEEAVGWLALEDFQRALEHFEDALTLRHSPIAEWGRDLARKKLGIEPPPPPPTPRPVVLDRPVRAGQYRRFSYEPSVEWSTAEAEALRFETARDFTRALEIYRRVTEYADNTAAVFTGRARCHLQLGELGEAIDYANRAVKAESSRVDALAIIVRGYLGRKQYADALSHADRLVMQAADDGSAHYLRGKALLALGRLVEARDVFDLACTLQPNLIEAMLLRREVDRSLGHVRNTVGTQNTVIDIPENLAELRDVLLSGRTQDAIAELEEARFVNDPDAQLVLARFLTFDGQLERAVTVYDRVASSFDSHRHVALVGKGTALLDLGSAQLALAVFDQLLVDKPSDLDAREGRARALDVLGRAKEAAAEYARFVALAAGRSDLRVRAAQLWLEAHR